MAEELLDDAEFWLPSHFLTDDDILIDLDFSSSSDKDSMAFGSGSGSGFGSDLDLLSNGSVTGSDTDQDVLLAELTRQVASSVIPPDFSPLSKGWNLLCSPQSTLCGCLVKEECSSRASPNGSVSPPSSTDEEGSATTLDLLNKAASEVGRFKIIKEKTTTTTTATRAGTGFFDCSNKRQPSPISTTPTHLPVFSRLHYPPFSHVQQQMKMRRQQMISSEVNIINKQSNEQNNKNRPLGLPQTAWPPLQAQNQPIQSGPQVFMGQPGPKREGVGTGVFLPRRVDTPIDTRKKPEGGITKTRKGKGNNNGSNSHHQRSGSEQPTSKSSDIRLPPEWTY